MFSWSNIYREHIFIIIVRRIAISAWDPLMTHTYHRDRLLWLAHSLAWCIDLLDHVANMPLISSLTGELFGLRRRLELFCAILHTKTIPSRSSSVGLSSAKTLSGALSMVTCVPPSRSPENILLSNVTSSGKTNNQYKCLQLSSFSIATYVAWFTCLVGAHSRLWWNRSGERVQKSWGGALIRTRCLLSC